MLTLFIIIGILLVAAISFFRPAPVVVVRERNDGNLLWVALIIGLAIGLYISFDAPEEVPSVLPLEQGEYPLKDQEDSVADAKANQAPPSYPWQVSTPDTHINVAPPSRSGVTSTGYHSPHDQRSHFQNIILVKRFTDSSKAALLQRHFSQWSMRILEVDHAESPYWNCVFIENEAEGRAKIREWNQHRQDFEHMGLELTLTRIEIH